MGKARVPADMGRFCRSNSAVALVCLVAAIAAGLHTGCGSRGGLETGEEKAVPTRDIKTVMEHHAPGLMIIPGVVGVYLGETESGTPCIKILVAKKTSELTARLPESLEGHPVVVVETGEIEALPEND